MQEKGEKNPFSIGFNHKTHTHTQTQDSKIRSWKFFFSDLSFKFLEF